MKSLKPSLPPFKKISLAITYAHPWNSSKSFSSTGYQRPCNNLRWTLHRSSQITKANYLGKAACITPKHWKNKAPYAPERLLARYRLWYSKHYRVLLPMSRKPSKHSKDANDSWPTSIKTIWRYLNWFVFLRGKILSSLRWSLTWMDKDIRISTWPFHPAGDKCHPKIFCWHWRFRLNQNQRRSPIFIKQIFPISEKMGSYSSSQHSPIIRNYWTCKSCGKKAKTMKILVIKSTESGKLTVTSFLKACWNCSTLPKALDSVSSRSFVWFSSNIHYTWGFSVIWKDFSYIPLYWKDKFWKVG